MELSAWTLAFTLWPYRNGKTLLLLYRLRYDTCIYTCNLTCPYIAEGFIHFQHQFVVQLVGYLHESVEYPLVTTSSISPWSLGKINTDTREQGRTTQTKHQTMCLISRQPGRHHHTTVCDQRTLWIQQHESVEDPSATYSGIRPWRGLGKWRSHPHESPSVGTGNMPSFWVPVYEPAYHELIKLQLLIKTTAK